MVPLVTQSENDDDVNNEALRSCLCVTCFLFSFSIVGKAVPFVVVVAIPALWDYIFFAYNI